MDSPLRSPAIGAASFGADNIVRKMQLFLQELKDAAPQVEAMVAGAASSTSETLLMAEVVLGNLVRAATSAEKMLRQHASRLEPQAISRMDLLQMAGRAGGAAVFPYGASSVMKVAARGNQRACRLLQREMSIYKRLRRLQGGVVPRVIQSTVFEGSALLELERVDVPRAALDGADTAAPEDAAAAAVREQAAIYAAFEELWDEGVVHGDVARRNLCIELGPGGQTRACIIDFETASLREELGVEKFKAALHAEQATVQALQSH